MHLKSIFILAVVSLSSCYNPKVKSLENELSIKDEQIHQLESTVDHLQSTNNSLLDRMADMSVINQTEAESIKNSLVSLNRQNEYIQELSEIIEEKDSINNALVHNLKSSLINFHDEDIAVEVKGSAVYISISDRLLFQSGSSRVLESSKEVLSKVSRIINDHNHLNVLIEGHTDNLPISNDMYKDNWDLSAQRALAVVRTLQREFSIRPERMSASGRGEYIPKAANTSTLGRQKNRRTNNPNPETRPIL